MTLYCAENLQSESGVGSKPESVTLQSVTLSIWPSLRLSPLYFKVIYLFTACFSILHVQFKYFAQHSIYILNLIEK